MLLAVMAVRGVIGFCSGVMTTRGTTSRRSFLRQRDVTELFCVLPRWLRWSALVLFAAFWLSAVSGFIGARGDAEIVNGQYVLNIHGTLAAALPDPARAVNRAASPSSEPDPRRTRPVLLDGPNRPAGTSEPDRWQGQHRADDPVHVDLSELAVRDAGGDRVPEHLVGLVAQLQDVLVVLCGEAGEFVLGDAGRDVVASVPGRVPRDQRPQRRLASPARATSGVRRSSRARSCPPGRSCTAPVPWWGSGRTSPRGSGQRPRRCRAWSSRGSRSRRSSAPPR